MKKLIALSWQLLFFVSGLLLTNKKTAVGGQAVIEGVMMRSPNRWAVAVRGTDKRIHVKKEYLKNSFWLLRLPLIRGTVALLQSVVLGIKAIEFSASCVLEDEDDSIGTFGMVLTIAISFVIGIAAFVFLPLFLTKALEALIPAVKESNMIFNLTDGLFRVIIFLLYIFGVGLWSEMRRVFQYHGAEHKAIHAYENGDTLEPSEILTKYSSAHPRCGTSFLLIVMIISIVVFSFIPREWSILYKFLSRLVLIPLVAGISYELLKLSAKYKRLLLMKLLMWPGLALQALTTKEPTEDQVEVAVRALKEALAEGDV